MKKEKVTNEASTMSPRQRGAIARILREFIRAAVYYDNEDAYYHCQYCRGKERSAQLLNKKGQKYEHASTCVVTRARAELSVMYPKPGKEERIPCERCGTFHKPGGNTLCPR